MKSPHHLATTWKAIKYTISSALYLARSTFTHFSIELPLDSIYHSQDAGTTGHLCYSSPRLCEIDDALVLLQFRRSHTEF